MRIAQRVRRVAQGWGRATTTRSRRTRRMDSRTSSVAVSKVATSQEENLKEEDALVWSFDATTEEDSPEGVGLRPPELVRGG